MSNAVAEMRAALADRPLAREESRCVKKPIGCEKQVSQRVSQPWSEGDEWFKDKRSLAEYLNNSALCQDCQDHIFGMLEGGDDLKSDSGL